MTIKNYWLVGCALAALSTPVAAQDPAPAPGGETASESEAGPDEARDIIVTGQLVFRNRTEDPNPVLSYDIEYFQRFEPVSVGEMLKRVPGVTFTSDVLEYDGVQMRGLPSGFTQVLINGRRTPGGEADGSFFVDRLPAELVERIEIVRAPRADQPSEGVAGTLNVITKESVTLEGGFAKAGALINEDGGVRPSAALAYAGRLGEATSFWAGLNYQQRRNPKQKVSYRFGGEPSGARPYNTDPEFDDFEAQADTRDGTDLSGNAEITTRFGDEGFFRVGGLFVDTNRDEHEVSETYEGEELDYVEVETQHEEISQNTYALTADAAIPLGFARLGLGAGWSAFRENTDIEVVTENFEDDEVEEETDQIDIDDDEYSGTVSLAFGGNGRMELKTGIDLLHKRRVGGQAGDFLSSDFRIEEERYDPYVRATFKPSAKLTLDAGLRFEITRRDVRGVNEDDEIVDGSYRNESLNPSLHLRYASSADGQLRASLARTVRRPNYDFISPIEEEETPSDEDRTVGNPSLRNERAWGVDVGYEQRLGRGGIVGVNLFYRDVSDLIELVAIEDIGDGSLFTPRNIGDGETWGLEVDFSAPLTRFGLPDTGLFANYTYLDSETTDPFTGETRRFNYQPHHVYNVGFIQTLKSVDASFGASVSGRSKSVASNFDETVALSYDPDLEAFVEKRLGKSLVLRLSAQNLLNRRKDEVFRKYDGDSFAEVLENRAAGELDEFEIESEQAGRLFQVTLRAAF
jgi:outer membrane receptor protein involved in Fe transport